MDYLKERNRDAYAHKTLFVFRGVRHEWERPIRMCCQRNGALTEHVFEIKRPYSARLESSRSHKGLSPCDFDLIPKMKEPLCGIRFRTVPEILQAGDRSIRTINTTGAAKGILRLPHRWQWVVHNAGDYIEGQ